MGWMELVASLAKSLAWPIVAGVSIVVLRKSIAGAITQRLSKLKVGSVEINFETFEEYRAKRELDASKSLSHGSDTDVPSEPKGAEGVAVEPAQAQLIETSPVGAFITAFIELEKSLRLALHRHSEVERRSALKMALAARKLGILSDEGFFAFQEVGVVRNRLVHGDGTLTVAQATELVEVIESLRTEILRNAFVLMQVQSEKPKPLD